MSDQLRWFKLWCSAPLDPAIATLPRGLRWAWAAAGCYTQVHGTRGRLVINESDAGLIPLAVFMGTKPELVYEELLRLPHLTAEKRHGDIVVTWDNWTKFQRDSTQANRQKASRSKRRGEESTTLPTLPSQVGQGKTATAKPKFVDTPCGCGKPNCDRNYWGHMYHSAKPGQVWDQCGCWECRKATRETDESHG